MFVRPFPNSHGLSYIELRVCLFGGEIGWIEDFEKKIGKENFFEVCLVGWRERKINGGTQLFSFRAHQKVVSINGKTIKGRK